MTPAGERTVAVGLEGTERLTAWRLLAKRTVDLFLVITTTPITAPVGLLVGAIVRLRLGSPVVFVQERPGRDGVPFRLYKFRTMSDLRSADGELLADSKRLDAFGRLLRSSSLDELPELWNVLKGDMSIVGPRPLLMRYEPFYRGREKLRSKVRPGITGLAQINGRNTATWDRRLSMDAQYVETLSLRQDIEILFRTFFAVARSDGLVADPRSVMLNLDEERGSK